MCEESPWMAKTKPRIFIYASIYPSFYRSILEMQNKSEIVLMEISMDVHLLEVKNEVIHS